MTNKLNVGILMPTRGLLMQGDQPDDIEQLISMAVTSEEAGIDSVWVGDSLTAKPRLEPLTTLSAIASRTSSVRLGTAVMLGPLRHPVSLAHAATTADLISRGRIVLGMGVGGAFNKAQRAEWMNAGINPRYRGGRLEELLKIFKPLTRGEKVTFHGRHFDVDNVSIKPVSRQPNGVPVLVAAHGRSKLERQFQRVTLGDGSISISDYPEEYSLALTRIRDHAENQGIDNAGLEKAFYMTINMHKDRVSAAEEADKFLKLYYGINIWQDRWGPWGPAEEAISRIGSYENVGAQTVIVRFASFDQEKQLDIFLSDVLPYL